MREREKTSLAVTGCFLAVLLAFIAAGLSPAVSGPEPAAHPADRYVPDAQFAQYLEYRAQLDTSSDCQ